MTTDGASGVARARERRLRTIAFDLGWEACEKFNEPVLRELMTKVWDEGFTEACEQHMAQERDPSHIFRRDNPHEGDA